MDWPSFVQQTLKLLGSKKLAATICITWVLLHIALAYPSQFVQLSAFYDNQMYLIDMVGLFSAACLIISSLAAAFRFLMPRLRQLYLKRSAVKEIQRILKTPESDDYKLFMLLYNKPNSLCNPYDPLVRRLMSYCLVCGTGIAQASDFKIYKGPFDLTHFARQYMNTHCRH